MVHARGWPVAILGVLGRLDRRPCRCDRMRTVARARSSSASRSARSSRPGWVDTPRSSPRAPRPCPAIWPAAAVVGLACCAGWRGGLAGGGRRRGGDLVEVVEPTAEHASTTRSCCSCSAAASATAPTWPARGRRRWREAMRLQAAGARARPAGPHRPRRRAPDARLHPPPRRRHRAARRRELGAMAGEQERLLRTLVSGVAHRRARTQTVEGEVDLRPVLRQPRRRAWRAPRRPGRPGAAAAPGRPTSWSPRSEAALDNVRQHAGDGARAWVLLEDARRRGRRHGPRQRASASAGTARRGAAARAGSGVGLSIRGRLERPGRHGRSTTRASARAPRSSCGSPSEGTRMTPNQGPGAAASRRASRSTGRGRARSSDAGDHGRRRRRPPDVARRRRPRPRRRRVRGRRHGRRRARGGAPHPGDAARTCSSSTSTCRACAATRCARAVIEAACPPGC